MTHKEILKITNAIGKKKAVWDKVNNIVFIPVANKNKWYGVQVYYLRNFLDSKEKIKQMGIINFCLEYILGSNIIYNNPYGFSFFYRFKYKDAQYYEYEVAHNIFSFVEHLLQDKKAKFVIVKK